MKLSACNQLSGIVTAIEKGATTSIVRLDRNSTAITASIINAAVEDLGLAVGKPATAIIRASDVMIGA